MSGVMCKRCAAFSIFTFFACVTIGFSFVVDTTDTTTVILDDSSVKQSTILFYILLFVTAIRYRQMIDECKRGACLLLLITSYIVYWITLLQKIEMNPYIGALLPPSMITFACDCWVFTSKAYLDSNGNEIAVLPQLLS
jgi:hypothetical protein